MKDIIIAVLIAIVVGLGIYMYVRKPDLKDDKYDKQYQAIDSLINDIDRLQQNQLKLDSIINNHELKIKSINQSIDSTKRKLKQIRIDNGTKIQAASNYSPTEIDSFFTDRYKTLY
jgi:uncharacterized protein HemX